MIGIARDRITLLKEQKTILGKREEDNDRRYKTEFSSGHVLNFDKG